MQLPYGSLQMADCRHLPSIRTVVTSIRRRRYRVQPNRKSQSPILRENQTTGQFLCEDRSYWKHTLARRSLCTNRIWSTPDNDETFQRKGHA